MNELAFQNAIITSAEITNDEHGVLTAWIFLDYGWGGQGFGGYALYMPKSLESNPDIKDINIAGYFIWRVMEIAGVSKWSQLAGKTIRVQSDENKVHAIGHIVKNDWFNPSHDFVEAFKKQYHKQ